MKRRNSKEPSEAQKAARARNFDIMRLEGMIATARSIRLAPHTTHLCMVNLEATIVSCTFALRYLRENK